MKIEASYTWSVGDTSKTVTACVDSSLPESASDAGELVAAIVRALHWESREPGAINGFVDGMKVDPVMSEIQKQVRQ